MFGLSIVEARGPRHSSTSPRRGEVGAEGAGCGGSCPIDKAVTPSPRPSPLRGEGALWRRPRLNLSRCPSHKDYHSAFVTFTFVPARTADNVFTSPTALANTLQGLASRVSSPRLIGVRPKPMAIAGPSGQ
jgi:hypothetical protein